MDRPRLTLKQRDATYFPAPGQMSESLKRARKPFIWKNRFAGLSIAAFAVGVYAYSISAVQQDDFSDVEDLLPPLEQRQSVKSIEDEERERGGPSLRGIPLSVSSGSAMSQPPPGQKDWGGSSELDPAATGTGRTEWAGQYLPRRLSELEWVRSKGWVEGGTGNVLVWGAPPVDASSVVGEGKTAKGSRLV